MASRLKRETVFCTQMSSAKQNRVLLTFSDCKKKTRKLKNHKNDKIESVLDLKSLSLFYIYPQKN